MESSDVLVSSTVIGAPPQMSDCMAGAPVLRTYIWPSLLRIVNSLEQKAPLPKNPHRETLGHASQAHSFDIHLFFIGFMANAPSASGDGDRALRAAEFRLFGGRAEFLRARVKQHLALAEVVHVEYVGGDDGAPPVALAPSGVDAHAHLSRHDD